MPVVPAQAGGPPRGHAAGVCEEGQAVQSGGVGTDGRERLEAHPDHAVGDGTGECECTERRRERGERSEKTPTDAGCVSPLLFAR